MIIESPDLAFLTLDETFEEGYSNNQILLILFRILMESDSNLIAARVTRFRPEDEMMGFKMGGLNEQTLTQAFNMARDQIQKSLMK